MSRNNRFAILRRSENAQENARKAMFRNQHSISIDPTELTLENLKKNPELLAKAQLLSYFIQTDTATHKSFSWISRPYQNSLNLTKIYKIAPSAEEINLTHTIYQYPYNPKANTCFFDILEDKTLTKINHLTLTIKTSDHLQTIEEEWKELKKITEIHIIGRLQTDPQYGLVYTPGKRIVRVIDPRDVTFQNIHQHQEKKTALEARKNALLLKRFIRDEDQYDHLTFISDPNPPTNDNTQTQPADDSILLLHTLQKHPCASNASENHYDVRGYKKFGSGQYADVFEILGKLKTDPTFGFVFENNNRAGKLSTFTTDKSHIDYQSKKETFLMRAKKEFQLMNRLNSFNIKPPVFYEANNKLYSFLSMRRLPGKNLEELLITSHENGHSKERHEHQPFGGSKYLGKEIIDAFDVDSLDGNPLSSDELIEVMVKLLLFAEKIRLHRIVHRDIKPGNVMINVKSKPIFVAIYDFGLSCTDSHIPSKTQVGTPMYFAPEMWKENAKLTPKIDEYAIGFMFAELFDASNEFLESVEDVERFSMNVRFKDLFQYRKDLSSSQKETIANIIYGLTARDIDQRWSFSQALKEAEPLLLERRCFHISNKERLIFIDVVLHGIQTREELNKLSITKTCFLSYVDELHTTLSSSLKKVSDRTFLVKEFLERLDTPLLLHLNNKAAIENKLNQIFDRYKSAVTAFKTLWSNTTILHSIEKLNPTNIMDCPLTLENIVHITEKFEKYCKKYSPTGAITTANLFHQQKKGSPTIEPTRGYQNRNRA